MLCLVWSYQGRKLYLVGSKLDRMMVWSEQTEQEMLYLVWTYQGRTLYLVGSKLDRNDGLI